jgi:hypothetical protein
VVTYEGHEKQVKMDRISRNLAADENGIASFACM